VAVPFPSPASWLSCMVHGVDGGLTSKLNNVPAVHNLKLFFPEVLLPASAQKRRTTSEVQSAELAERARRSGDCFPCTSHLLPSFSCWRTAASRFIITAFPSSNRVTFICAAAGCVLLRCDAGRLAAHLPDPGPDHAPNQREPPVFD
jgi:hypothetical protein